MGVLSLVIALIWMWALARPFIHDGSAQYIDVWFPLVPKMMFFGGIGAVVVAAIFALVGKRYKNRLNG